MMLSDEPFAVLGLAPTLDAAAVKRAWFDALARHPPHQDPVGFRRLRAAYEALSRPGALAAAYLRSPVDVARLAQDARARFDEALQRASEEARVASAGEEAVARFVERCSRLSWEEVLRASSGA